MGVFIINKIVVPEVTERNTKKEIMEAYNFAVHELSSSQQGISNPIKEVEKKKVETIIAKSKEARTGDIEAGIATLKTSVATTLDDLLARIQYSTEDLQSINDDVELKKKDLEEMFNIKTEAFTLASLVNANRATEISNAEKMNTARLELESRYNEIKDVGAAIDAEFKEKRAIAAKKNAQDEEDYAYRIKKAQRDDNDKWDIEKAKREKIIFDKEEILKVKIKDISERETFMNEMETIIENLPTEVLAAVSLAKEELTQILEDKHKTEKEYLEKYYTGEKKILENRIALLVDASVQNKAELNELKDRLEKSNDRNSELASKVVDASAKNEVISSLKSIVSENSKSNNSK